eukprot:2646235-Heterocapsa_arctica.AAC.1
MIHDCSLFGSRSSQLGNREVTTQYQHGSGRRGDRSPDRSTTRATQRQGQIRRSACAVHGHGDDRKQWRSFAQILSGICR